MILELEASGPGNERNIVKWHAQASSQQGLRIQLRNNGNPTEYSRVDVVMCFGRELNAKGEDPWKLAPFLRAVAHSEYLTDILNDLRGNESLSFTVLSSSELITSYEEFGREAAAQYAKHRGPRTTDDKKIGAA